MYRQAFSLGNFLPLWEQEQPGGDTPTVRVMAGKNFAWHGRGVYSAYQHEITCELPVGETKHPGNFHIDRQQYSFLEGGVYAHYSNGCSLVHSCPRDMADPTRSRYKWTYAYVGTVHYFSHPEWSNIIYYDEHTREWGCFRESCWDGPIYGITHAENRLVVMLSDVVGWSKFDRGQEGWNCRSPCGSGYQSLALIRYGTPLTVMPYKGGWLSFTTMGVMLSRPIMDLVPDPEGDGVLAGPVIYRHEEFSFDHIPIGPTAIEHIDEQDVIWITDRGYVHIEQSMVAALYPEWSAWFRDHWRDNKTENRIDDILLSHIRPHGLLITSYRNSEGTDYNSAAVLHMDLNRWGSFDYNHRGFAWRQETGSVSHWAPNFAFYTSDGFAEITHGPTADSWIRIGTIKPHSPNEFHQPGDKILCYNFRLGTGKRPWSDDVVAFSIRGREDFWQRTERTEETPCHFDAFISGTEDGVTHWINSTEPLIMTERGTGFAEYACHVAGYSMVLDVECANDNDFFEIRHIQMAFLPIGE